MGKNFSAYCTKDILEYTSLKRMTEKEKEDELRRRYFEAKEKGKGYVECRDLWPDNYLHFPVYSIQLLARLFEPKEELARQQRISGG